MSLLACFGQFSVRTDRIVCATGQTDAPLSDVPVCIEASRSVSLIAMKSGARPAKSGDPVQKLLEKCRTIAVVGLSSNHSRASYGVAQYMQSAGYRILPVNPNVEEVLGEKAVARLEDIREPVDIVNIFHRSEHVAGIVDAAIRIGAKAVWMQEGVIDQKAAERARQAGLFVMMDSCLLKEHSKRFRAPR